MSQAYEEFLRSKMVTAPERGIAVDANDINPLLKPHQAAIVRWALRKGNAAIFAAFGLGKTFMQLEIARDACFYLESADRQMATPTLFDLLKVSEETAVPA